MKKEKIEVCLLEKIETEGTLITDEKSPYLEYEYEFKIKGKVKKYNPDYGVDKICARCGHSIKI